MQLAIIKKKQCDAKALTIVEQLLEPVVNAEWFLQNLRHINRSHLEDVIEERAIVKLCGYVLCNKPLTVIIRQQYHISMKKNKVYDVSKRKNYCSSRCYGASSYLLEQMLTSPLWLRDKEDVPTFQLLPIHELKHSTPGEEVEINPNNVDFKVQRDMKSRTESCSESYSTNTAPDSTDCSLNQTSEGRNTRNLDELLNNCSSTYVKNILNSSDDTNDRINCVFTEGTKITEITNTQTFSGVIASPSQNSTEQECTVLPDSFNVDPITDTSAKESNVKSNKENSSVCQDENTETEGNSSNCEQQESFKTVLKILETARLDKISVTTSTDKLNEGEHMIRNKDDLNVSKNIEELFTTSKNKEQEISSTSVDVPQDKVPREKSEKKKHRSSVESSKKSSRSSSVTCIYSIAMRVEKSVKEWITKDTLCLLLGKTDEKHRLIENITKHDKYLHICKRLNKLQLEDEREERAESSTKGTLKPIPHLVDLEEEGKKMEIKVRAFYSGSMDIAPIAEGKSVKKKDEPDPIFPLVDSYAPKALRRRIFLDKLNRTLPDLLRALAGNSPPHITAQYIYSGERCSAIKTLATTFALSATNIVFKSAEWTLVGLILMKLLSIMDPSLKALLMRKQASMYISMILMSYKLDSNYLDRLVAEITNSTDIVCIHDS